MPTTRRGSETPGRDRQQKIAQRPAVESTKADAIRNKSSDTSKADHNIENVRSTRRSQTVASVSNFIPRRTRGTKAEQVKQEETTAGKKTRKDVLEGKLDDIKQAESVLTRNSKRTAESPKDVPTKKQRTVAIESPPKPAEATQAVRKPVDKGAKNDGENQKEAKVEAVHSDAKREDKDSEVNVKVSEAPLRKEEKTVTEKVERGQRSRAGGPGAVGSLQGADVVSPRRSSRTVVPNSRYRDMVDLGKKKSVTKMEVKKEAAVPPAKKHKVDYTSISVQQQGDMDVITEEIITEETKIDPLAQMNLMDDMLILPANEVGMTEAQPIDTEPETTKVSSAGIKVVKYPSAKLVEYQSDSRGASSVETAVIVETTIETPGETPEEVVQDTTDVERDNITDSAKNVGSLLQRGSMPEPQVIVIPSDTGKHMNKIIIPKDPYRARLEQAFEKKGSSMVIGPSTGKAKAKKIIVTPTHQHASKKEAQRAKMANQAEKVKEIVIRKDLGKPVVTSVIYPRMQRPGPTASQIIHSPEKHMKYTVIPRTEDKNSTSGTEFGLHCDEELEMVGESSGVNDKSKAAVASTAGMATVPNVKVVYVKAKQMSKPNIGTDKKKPDSKEVSTDSIALKEGLRTLKKFSKIGETGEDGSECEIGEKIANTDSVHTFLSERGRDESESAERSKPEPELEEMTSIPVEQNIANTLCQVIEYKHQPTTAIEYVLLDNKMVPIHKPFQSGSHGRHTARQTQPGNRATPGRVESGTPKDHGTVKKIPLSAAQTTFSTVMSHIGDEHSQSTNQHIKYAISSGQMEATDVSGGAEVKTEVQVPRVIHGYIDRPARSESPTQIVEISTEAFNKEIYGEQISLDVVSGQIVEDSVDETSQESIPAQTVSEHEVETENQSVGGGAGYQSIEEAQVDQSLEDGAGYRPIEESEVNQSEEATEDQSMKESTHTLMVNTDDEEAVIYTENEESGQVEEVSNWPVRSSVVSSGTDMIMTVPEGETQVPAKDGLVHIEGLDNAQIPENATVTVEKLASGGEIVIMQIKDTAVSETLEKIKTSKAIGNSSPSTSDVVVRKTPTVVKARVMEKPAQVKRNVSGMKILPIQKLSEVKITPVRAYHKSESQSGDKSQSSAGVVSKTTGTNTEISDAEEFTELEVEEEEEAVKFEETSPDKGNPYQEYIVVRLPEGAEVKQLQARPRRETRPLGEEVTMDEDGLYVCVDCGHKTENRGNWFKHRRKHLGIRPHACTKCAYRAATSSNLKRHMQIHDDVRNFQCAYCNTLFRQKIHLERHLKYKHEEKNVQCPLCDYVCSSENPDLKIHIKRRHMPHEGALNAFTCDVCGLMTVSKKDLKQHKKFHKNGPELKLFCEHCSFVTDCVSRLRRHMLIHTKERPFQCGLCTYRASQKEHVLRHMRSQHGVEVERNQRRSLLEKNYRIPQEILVAGLDQTSSSSNKEVSSESDLGPFEKSDYSSTDKIFACNYCSMKFAKLINLYKHLYAQHKQVMPDEGPNDFQCVVCDFRTNNKKNLLVHMRKHNMQDHSPPTHVYSCVLCRYINPRRRNLFQHMKKKHGIEIIMKDDGLNCYVTLENAAAQVQGQNIKSSVMALSDIVTTQTMDDAAQNLFIAESSDDNATFQAEKITIDNIIPDDMESYVVTDSTQDHGLVSPQVSVSSIPHTSVQEHEAAEAIEGLQALAEQAGILETQNIDNDMTTEIVSSGIEISSSEIMNDGEVLHADETLTTTQAIPEDQPGQGTEGFELSSEQLNQLATGDYVEINGEVYKVEIAPDGS